MKKDEYLCDMCDRTIEANEGLWVTATETICEGCHVGDDTE